MSMVNIYNSDLSIDRNNFRNPSTVLLSDEKILYLNCVYTINYVVLQSILSYGPF